MSEINNYGPVADLYDLYVPATFDIPFFLNETQKEQGEVLELMSGTGRVSIPLLEAGVKLTCADLSAELNAVFEGKLNHSGLQADIYQVDVRELEIPKKFDMVIIPFHSFAHILTPGDQRKVFDRIHQHLTPGGIFICTLGNPAVRKKPVDGQLRLAKKYPLPDEQGTLLFWVREEIDPDDNQVVEALEFFEEYDASGLLTAKRLMALHFRLSGRAEIEDLAREAGFKVKAFYGDYSYGEFNADTSPFMIWCFERVD
jgi:SAM-dependent methyltransferase